jgi:hypothetical protein
MLATLEKHRLGPCREGYERDLSHDRPPKSASNSTLKNKYPTPSPSKSRQSDREKTRTSL